MQNLKLPAYIHAVFIGLLIVLVVAFMILARSFLVPMLFATYTAMLLVPFCEQLEKWKFPRALATVTGVVTALLSILGLFTFFFIQLRNFAKDLDNVQERLLVLGEQLNGFLNNTLGLQIDATVFLEKARVVDLIKDNSEGIGIAILNTVGSLAGVVLIPVFLFLFLLYRDHIARFIQLIFKRHSFDHVNNVLVDMRNLVKKYILGLLKVMLILAILSSLSLIILGIKHAVFFGVFAALMNLIPYVGPLMAAVLPISYALLTTDSLFYPFAIFIAFNLIQILESNFLTPKIVGSNVSLNPLITFLAILIGGTIWGVIGMILFIPTAAIIKKLFELSEATAPYAFLMGDEKTSKKG